MNIVINKNYESKVGSSVILSEPCGVLTLHIEGCNNLPIADITSSDPYVELTYMDDVYRTEIIFRDLNPRWEDESFDLLVYDLSLQSATLSVFDYDKTTADDFLGDVQISFKDLTPKVPKTIELPLSNCSTKATILITLSYEAFPQKQKGPTHDFDTNDLLLHMGDLAEADTFDMRPSGPSSFENQRMMSRLEFDRKKPFSKPPLKPEHSSVSSNPSRPLGLNSPSAETKIVGALIITSISCKSLHASSNEKCDPYVSFSYGSVKRKTKIIRGSCSPAFPESFTFVLRDTDSTLLVLKVKNHKKKIGQGVAPTIGQVAILPADLIPVGYRSNDEFACEYLLQDSASPSIISFKARLILT
jgi:Ca2+-dependent lipid-binding protein